MTEVKSTYKTAKPGGGTGNASMPTVKIFRYLPRYVVSCINVSVEFTGAAGNLKARFENMAKAGEEVIFYNRYNIINSMDGWIDYCPLSNHFRWFNVTM